MNEVRVSFHELAITWKTLLSVSHNYEAGSLGEASLIEARRLIEAEVRAQHGDESWASLHADNSPVTPGNAPAGETSTDRSTTP